MNSHFFKWDRNNFELRYGSRRVIRRRAGCRHNCGVYLATRRGRRTITSLHRLPNGSAPFDAVGIKLCPHCLGIKVIEPNLNFELVLVATSFNFHFAKVQRGPFLVQAVPPIDNLPAGGAFVYGT